MRSQHSSLTGRQRGQTLVLFTFLIVIFVGFLALVVDLGFTFGQRRFDQNGADAASLAAAQVIAGSVTPFAPSGSWISTTDCAIYGTVRSYAGLSQISNCGSNLSTSPSGTNQNAALGGSNNVAVTLEYCDGVSRDNGGSNSNPPCDSSNNTNWCYSPASISALPGGTPALRSPAETQCTLLDDLYPPRPGANTYKVRVTVSSTTASSFARLPGWSSAGPTFPQTDASLPACPPIGSTGDTTCAWAVGVINGIAGTVASGGLIPVTTADCNIQEDPGVSGGLYQLWAGAGSITWCGTKLNPWAQIIDLSKETVWCNLGGSTNYDYVNVMPDTSTTPAQPYTSYGQPPSPPPSGCATAVAADDHQWYRAGYVPDPNWTGSGNPRVDVPLWISQQFGGWVYAPGRGIPNGNYVPTYCHQGGACATMGNNIAQGFYCASQQIAADGIGCSANPWLPSQTTGTYFFRSDKLTLPCAAPDGTVFADVGCRDASVATYDNAEWTKGNERTATQWDTPGKKGSSGPSRVELVEILNMRLYCQVSATGFCDGPPKAIVGSASNSDVWGLFLSIAESQCPPGQTCGGGLSWTGNVFGLGG